MLFTPPPPFVHTVLWPYLWLTPLPSLCFGTALIPASAGSPSGQIQSGANYPGGIDCAWVIGSASAYEGVTLTFNSVDIEPDFGDVMHVWDGDDRTAPLKTVRGKSSQCSKSADCNPDESSTSPSACNFASVSDLYGTCMCETGYSNGDCSESESTLFPTSGFVSITYETDINDDKTYAGWDINYKVCGDTEAGFDYCNDGTWNIEELNMGFLHPFYTLDGSDYIYSSSGHNNLVGSVLALREINANPDLLPNTQLKFEVLDTHHDAGMITGHAISFATTAFDGKGADVVVGGAYSGNTIASHNVLKGFGMPQVSPVISAIPPQRTANPPPR